MSKFAKSFMKKSPLQHWIGKHPGKDGHVRSEHKARRRAKREASDTEFEEKYGVHPSKTRRYMDGTLVNTETNEIIEE
jgi:hypothetical protein